MYPLDKRTYQLESPLFANIRDYFITITTIEAIMEDCLITVQTLPGP